MKFIFLIATCFLSSLALSAQADDFFDINDINYYQTPPPDNVPAVWDRVEKVVNGRHIIVKNDFIPCLKVQLSVKSQTTSNTVFAHVYFYDDSKKLVGKVVAPAVVNFGDGRFCDWPVILPADKDQTIFFAIPKEIIQKEWSAVIVFGDSKGVDARLFHGAGELVDYDYPEKNSLQDRIGPPIDRKSVAVDIVEHVIKTGIPTVPQITFFLRPPSGMTDLSQAKGVLCMAIVAGRVDGVRRQLQGFEGGETLKGVLDFAENHKLVIVGWGTEGMWDTTKNWDDLSADQAWKTDKTLDQVAEAWTNGIQYFIKEYKIPGNGYLLWGQSSSAQFACRLALRRPDYFLAIHAHIPSSFDKPTPEASKILWCLTTGEMESGHERSLRFYAQCKALGYPMVYKAIIGLAHRNSDIADDIGLKFFEYALSVRDQRAAYDETLNNPLAQIQMTQSNGSVIQPWLESFCKPAYVGDAVNQGVVPYEQRETIPLGFRVPLPTKEIAEAWNK